MKTGNKLTKNNISIYLCAAAFCAVCGITAFVRSFPSWNVPVYLSSVLMMGLSSAMLCYLFAAKKEASRPMVLSALSGTVFIIVSFAAVYLINNVILGASRSSLAAFILAAVFAAVFIVGVALVSSAWKQLLPALLCAVLMISPVVYAAKTLGPITYKHKFENKITETRGLDDVSKQNRLIVNCDDSHWWGFWNELAENGEFSKERINDYILQYANSGVTDLMLNIFGQSSDTPTDVLTFRGDLYGKTEQNGKPVDYSAYSGLNALYREQNIDVFALWIDECRECGITPWLSLRMNDCHEPDEETSPLRGDLFYLAEKNGWVIGEKYGYYRHCVDYSIPEIRKLMLDYTREQLLRYDADGIELDFMREIYCFDYIDAKNDEIVAIMNDYMRETAKLVEEAEKKWGHDIKLSVRMMRDIEQCKVYGFDVLTWCKEKLIDSVTVTPRFSSNDSGMPIADWVEKCPEVEIWAGVETLVNTQSKGCCADASVVRGYGAQYLTAGADGLYLFNYMSSGTVGDREREVYDTCGSLGEILKHPRRHVLTYQDTAPEGYEPYEPLPVKIKNGRSGELEIQTGYIPDDAQVTVFIGFEAEIPVNDAPALTVNGRECTEAVPDEIFGRNESDGSPVPQGYCREDCFIYSYKITDPAGLPNLLKLEITNRSGKTVKATYAEVFVNV